MSNPADLALTGTYHVARWHRPCHLSPQAAFADPKVIPVGKIGITWTYDGRRFPLGLTVIAPETLADLLRIDWNNVPVQLQLTLTEDRTRGDAHGLLEALVPIVYLPWYDEFRLREADAARVWPHSLHDPFERPCPTCPESSLPAGFEALDPHPGAEYIMGVPHGVVQIGAVHRMNEWRRYPDDLESETADVLAVILSGRNQELLDGRIVLDTRRTKPRGPVVSTRSE